jgi:hypothetical protein
MFFFDIDWYKERQEPDSRYVARAGSDRNSASQAELKTGQAVFRPPVYSTVFTIHLHI